MFAAKDLDTGTAAHVADTNRNDAFTLHSNHFVTFSAYYPPETNHLRALCNADGFSFCNIPSQNTCLCGVGSDQQTPGRHAETHQSRACSRRQASGASFEAKPAERHGGSRTAAVLRGFPCVP